MLKLYSPKKAEEIIQSYDEWIRTVSKRYHISAAVIKSILYMELVRIDIMDPLADLAVSSNLFHKHDSSTGYSQIFGAVGLKAVNFAEERGISDYKTLRIPSDHHLDVKNPEDVRLVWNFLKDDRKANIEIAALNLLAAAEEMTGRIDFDHYTDEELKLILTRYNADTDHITPYGEEAFGHYLRYQKKDEEKQMKTGIIFDVDGTLWDTSEKLAGVWQSVIDRHDDLTVPCTTEDIIRNLGRPMDLFAADIFRGVSHEKVLEYMEEVEGYENQYLSEHLPDCYEGTHEVLKQLSETYPLFIVSNCQTGYIDICIRSAEAEEYITDFLCFGDNSLQKADNIRLIAERNGLEKFYYVGDTQMDYESTMQAGGEFIFAAYGFGTVDADVPVMKDIRELPDLLK